MIAGPATEAANWVPMGITTGRGPTSNSHTPNRTKKEVLGLPLHRRFHELLQQEQS